MHAFCTSLLGYLARLLVKYTIVKNCWNKEVEQVVEQTSYSSVPDLPDPFPSRTIKIYRQQKQCQF